MEILSSQQSISVVATPLLGRSREMKELERLLTDSTYRLVNLIGPGGVGKTRLALHLASLFADREQVAFVPLATVREPLLVLPAIGRSLGLFSDSQEGYEEFLVSRLAGVQALVVLDNLEQVIAVGPTIGRVLARCPGIRILATSRAPLEIGGEQLYPLAPLDVPAADVTGREVILGSGAVELFVDRARAVNPGFPVDDRSAETIAAICRRLDGLPLAIELAAARTNILSSDALLARLSNRLEVLGGGERQQLPDRMHTMRQAVCWSYDLLGPDAQRLFRKLSVFIGGFSLEAVESTVRGMGSERDTYDLIGELVDHSLVRTVALVADTARYYMLETIRDFGLEQLRGAGEFPDAQRDHALYFVSLAEAAEPNLVEREQVAWISRLDADLENIRAAVGWAIGNGREDIVLRIGGALWRFFSARSLVTESRSWLARALEATGPEVAPYRASALIAAGFLAEDQRDLDVARQMFDHARNLAAAIGSLKDEHHALIGLGTVAHERMEFEAATQYHEHATTLAREIGYDRGIAVGLANIATISYYRGDSERAAEYWQMSQDTLIRIGDLTGVAVMACNLGAAFTELEQYEKAERYLQHALSLQREMNHTRDLPPTLINLGDVARYLGDYTLSHDAYAEAISLLYDTGDEAEVGVALQGLAHLALKQNDLSGAARSLLESIRIHTEYDDPRSLLGCVRIAAEMASRNGRHEIVVELLEAESGLRESIDASRTASMERYVESFMVEAREALDPDIFLKCQERGRRITTEALPRHLMTVVRDIAGPQKASPSHGHSPAVPVAHDLTAREFEILSLLAQGNSTSQIADALYVSPRTVATHINNILGKLEVPSRTAAVAFAMRNGLV